MSIVRICPVCGDASVALDYCTGTTVEKFHRSQRRVEYVPLRALSDVIEAGEAVIRYAVPPDLNLGGALERSIDHLASTIAKHRPEGKDEHAN